MRRGESRASTFPAQQRAQLRLPSRGRGDSLIDFPARLSGASLITLAAAAIGVAAWAAQPAKVHTAETSPPQAVISSPDWQEKPTGADVAHLYPAEAQRQERSGAALLRCQVTPSGKLADCAVVSESPEGLNFGAAALKMADSFTMTPPAGGASATVNIPIKFDLH